MYANGADLYWARADGTGIRKLVTVAGIPFWLRSAPDGRVLRFTIRDPETDALSLWEVSADGSNLHPLLHGWNEPRHRVLRKLESGWKVLCVSIVPWRTKQHMGAFRQGSFFGARSVDRGSSLRDR